jgi:hypothetical protein
MTWRDGWYIVKNGRTHVGPFATSDEAERVRDDNPTLLAGCTIEHFETEERQ